MNGTKNKNTILKYPLVNMAQQRKHFYGSELHAKQIYSKKAILQKERTTTKTIMNKNNSQPFIGISHKQGLVLSNNLKQPCKGYYNDLLASTTCNNKNTIHSVTGVSDIRICTTNNYRTTQC